MQVKSINWLQTGTISSFGIELDDYRRGASYFLIMKKEVHFLEAPPHDPFLVSSDMEADLLRKYHYLERKEYEAYKRKERIHLFLICVVILLLSGLLYLIITVDPAKIDNFLM